MVDSWKDRYTNTEQPQSLAQWKRMLWQRDYRARLKENAVIYIKKSNIIKKN
jgi:hypothetical protein